MPKDLAKNMTSSKASWSGVSFSYVGDENKLSLFDIDLHIKSGETIGVIGGTGTGKSSLVQLIPRLYDATLGEVKVGGKNVKKYDLDSLRDSVAFVLQKNNLFSGTIKEKLRWGNGNATDEEIVEECRMAQADSFISSFPNGYDNYIEQGGKTSRALCREAERQIRLNHIRHTKAAEAMAKEIVSNISTVKLWRCRRI